MSAENSDQTRWFSEEVQPHEPMLRAWLRARFPTLGEPDDLVQESYLRLLRARAAGPIGSSKAFLFTTARNLAINILRHQRHERADVLEETALSTVLDGARGIPETVARSQEIEILTHAIQSLPKRCREVFTLRRLRGLSQKEVAARLGISESTVETQCIIALRKCVQRFRRYA